MCVVCKGVCIVCVCEGVCVYEMYVRGIVNSYLYNCTHN